MPSEQEVRELVRAAVEALTESVPSPATSPTEIASGPTAIAVGADHGGFPLKEKIAFSLKERGYDVRDCGTDSNEPVDYPEFAHSVARLVADGTCRWGIIVDGAGIGSCIVANKVPGIRAALCYDLSSARNSREHNHANVLTLGAGLIGTNLAMQIVDEWLATEWGPGRHERRVRLITDIDRRYRA
ncbi:MAG: ribose 5-phosphate isomerase B [Gammaproteobacteria bacterium]|nr:ribose 5-phosphate isomerase B [Gammaproteobacteria bacterium]